MQSQRSYDEFLSGKVRRAIPAGFDAAVDHPALFAWQRDAVSWALKQGRCALFEDCGLGKTVQELVWAQHVAQHTGRPVMVLAPLAVASQTVREAEKFGIPGVRQVRDQNGVTSDVQIAVCNYDRLHLLDPTAFAGVVLDESGCLKAYSGALKNALLRAFDATPYKLCATATPAPNDHLELGNHSEFLGVLSSHQMIARWFVNDASEFGTYRLKGHAVEDYWNWVCSWARCVGRPSDLGNYSDEGYVLPELRQLTHSAAVDLTEGRDDGQLFRRVEASATKLHAERRLTASARAEVAARLVHAEPGEAWVVWVDTDYDAEAVRAVLPEAVEVHGSQTPERKAELLGAFADGSVRILLTKAKLAGFGLNWQHCARMVFVGPSYSYEALYQAIRRCWRFGQHRAVDCHFVLAPTEQVVWQTLLRKAGDHESMKAEMYAASRRALGRAALAATYTPRPMPAPAWLETR